MSNREQNVPLRGPQRTTLAERLSREDFLLVPYLKHGRGYYILAGKEPLKEGYLGAPGQFERIVGKITPKGLQVFSAYKGPHSNLETSGNMDPKYAGTRDLLLKIAATYLH